MESEGRIPEFAMLGARLRCWPPFPWGDPMPDIYHLLDRARQAKVIPVLIKHYERLLDIQQKFNQQLFEAQRQGLKDLESALG